MPRRRPVAAVCALLALAAAAFLLLAAPAGGQAAHRWTVVSAADDAGACPGPRCTLRAAIERANASAGPDRIVFDIPGAALIRPTRDLPPLDDDGIEIDGATQPGWEAGEPPPVYLDGSGAGDAGGITVYAGGAVVRGLAFGNFQRQGIAVIGPGASGAVLEGNWAGMTADGRGSAPNRLSGIAVLAGAADVRIGGDCAVCPNRLAGNASDDERQAGHGVVIGGAGSVGALVAGNVIGLGAGGIALANDDGVLVVDGALAYVRNNIIAAARVAGVEVRDSRAPTAIDANWIGVGPGGRAAGNDVGVFIGRSAADVRVGAASPNVIAGNRVGVAVEQLAENARVEGNWIGLIPRDLGLAGSAPPDAALASAVALPNSQRAVSVVAGANMVFVWHNRILAGASGIVVRDENTAKVSVRRNAVAGAPGAVAGIESSAASEVMIGGEQDLGNNILGVRDAVRVVATDARECLAAGQDGTCGTKVGGNRIGRAAMAYIPFRAAAETATGRGIVLERGVRGVDVQENHIAGVAGAAIVVSGADSTGNLIQDNRFGGNGGIDIDLGGDGPTANDAEDADEGPNGLINAPRILEYRADLALDPTFGQWEIELRGDAPPNAQVWIHETGSVSYAPVGRGQADASGSWQAVYRADREPENPLRAISVGPDASTSEFSQPYLRPRRQAFAAGMQPVAWLGPERPLGTALAEFAGALSAVFRWDPAAGRWEVWSPRAPQDLATFTSVRRGDVLFVRLAEPAGITLEQSVPAGDARVRLAAGRNLVAWMGGEATASQVFRELERQAPGALRDAWQWDAEGSRWQPLKRDGAWIDEPLTGSVLDIRAAEPALWIQIP